MRQGSELFLDKCPQYRGEKMIYDGATGINYGADSENDLSGVYACQAFAGYAAINENYYASAADFGVLPEKNLYFTHMNRKEMIQKISCITSGEIEPAFMILTEKQEKRIFDLLVTEISLMATLYDRLFSCACKVMDEHAPRNARNQVDCIIFQTLFFRTVGLIGHCAVQSGELSLPDFAGPAAVYVRENTKEAEGKVNQGVQM